MDEKRTHGDATKGTGVSMMSRRALLAGTGASIAAAVLPVFPEILSMFRFLEARNVTPNFIAIDSQTYKEVFGYE